MNYVSTAQVTTGTLEAPDARSRPCSAAIPARKALPTNTSSSPGCCAGPHVFVPDIDALRNGPSRVVVGIGEQSGGQLCDRASRALAEALGVEPAMFPGGHIGFAEDPARFQARMREVVES